MEQRLFELLDGLVKYNTESPPGRNNIYMKMIVLSSQH